MSENNFFNNAEEFLEVFQIENPPYSQPIILTDRKVGFSVLRNYPENIQFSPAKKIDGNPDTVALIKVVYTHPTESTSQNTNPQKVPIIITIGIFRQYLSNHFDYNFNDNDNCPTQESVEAEKKSRKPIDLVTIDYFYNHTLNYFSDEKNNTYTGKEIIDKLFNQHCDTVHTLKGLSLRFKLKSKNWAIVICDFIINDLKIILEKRFDRKIETSDKISTYFQGYNNEDLKKLTTDSLNILGYKASKNIIVLFSLIILSIYILKYFKIFTTNFFDELFKINLFAAAFIISILWFMDELLPNLLFKFINLLIKLRVKLYFLRIKV